MEVDPTRALRRSLRRLSLHPELRYDAEAVLEMVEELRRDFFWRRCDGDRILSLYGDIYGSVQWMLSTPEYWRVIPREEEAEARRALDEFRRGVRRYLVEACGCRL